MNPIGKFGRWLERASSSEINDPNACALATVRLDADGRPTPNVRMVLLKGYDACGFVFYTNHGSAKGQELAKTPAAALDFHWKTLGRQVRVRGPVEEIAAAESDTYFATRPRDSQLSAWASEQSAPLAERSIFEARLAEMATRFPGAVPRPPYWGGFRLIPQEIEFWKAHEGRQHERELFRATPDGWASGLLYP